MIRNSWGENVSFGDIYAVLDGGNGCGIGQCACMVACMAVYSKPKTGLGCSLRASHADATYKHATQYGMLA